MQKTSLPEKRPDLPPVPLSGTAAAPPCPVNVDVYLRAPYSPFSNRPLLLGFLLATPVLCLLVYLLGHFSTSGLGLERDIRNARDRQTLSRFEQRVAASANRETLSALLHLHTVRLEARDLLAAEQPPSPGGIAALAAATQSMQPSAYPEDALAILREQISQLEALALRPPEMFASGQLPPFLTLIRAIRWHLSALQPAPDEETRNLLLARLAAAERLLFLKTSAMAAGGQDSRGVVAAVPPADIEHAPALLSLQNTSQDPRSFLNAVLAQWFSGTDAEQSALAEFTILPGVSVRDLVLGKHLAPPPVDAPADFAALALFRNALAAGNGADALRFASAAGKLWSGYEQVLAAIETQLVHAAATQELATTPATDNKGDYEDARRWLLAQQANLEARATKENVLAPWQEFAARFLRDTDPQRENAMDDVRAALNVFLAGPAAGQDPTQRAQQAGVLLRKYEDALAGGAQADARLHFMLELTQRVYLPLAQWVESREGPAPLEQAKLALWELLRETPQVSGFVDDYLPGNDTQWRFGAGPLEGVLLQADDDLYGDTSPTPDQITTEQTPVVLDWAALRPHEHFLYLQELAAALWLADQVEARRNGKNEDLSDAADGARLALPATLQDRVLSGPDAFAAMLLQGLPLPIRAGMQSEWLQRREAYFQHHAASRRNVLFDNFQFSESLTHLSEFYEACDVSPIFHPAFFRALEQYRCEIPKVLDLAPEQAADALARFPRDAGNRAALEEALDAGAPSAQPLIELMRAEALLGAFVREGYFQAGHKSSADWADVLEDLLPCNAIGKAADGDEVLSRLELSPEWPLWKLEIFEQAPRSVVQSARAALACWGYLGMRYGEGEYWSPTPFNQQVGDEGFEEKYRINRDAAPELFAPKPIPPGGA